MMESSIASEVTRLYLISQFSMTCRGNRDVNKEPTTSIDDRSVRVGLNDLIDLLPKRDEILEQSLGRRHVQCITRIPQYPPVCGVSQRM